MNSTVSTIPIRIMVHLYKGFFNKSTTKVFLKKIKTVLDINKIFLSRKSTFNAIMNETRFLLHGHHAYRSVDAEPNFDDFQA